MNSKEEIKEGSDTILKLPRNLSCAKKKGVKNQFLWNLGDGQGPIGRNVLIMFISLSISLKVIWAVHNNWIQQQI